MDNYDDIIDLPHYEPKYHPRMLPYKRAAQFSAFMPFSGYADLIKEEERKNEEQFEVKYEEEPTFW